MKLEGCIKYRDEDGTWYAEKRNGFGVVWAFTLDRNDALFDFTPEEALRVIPIVERNTMLRATYEARLVG